MNRIVFTLGIWLFPAACTALGAAGVFLLRRAGETGYPAHARAAWRRASCWPPACGACCCRPLPGRRAGTLPVGLPPALGLIVGRCGAFKAGGCRRAAAARRPTEHCRMGRMVLAVTLHNLPEGMVVGLAAALALHGDADAVSGALALSLGIGLQNIPEGAAVSLPLTQSGRTRGTVLLPPGRPPGWWSPWARCWPLCWPSG